MNNGLSRHEGYDNEGDGGQRGEAEDGPHEEGDGLFLLPVQIELDRNTREEVPHDRGGERQERQCGDGIEKGIRRVRLADETNHRRHDDDVAFGIHAVEIGILEYLVHKVYCTTFLFVDYQSDSAKKLRVMMIDSPAFLWYTPLLFLNNLSL